MKNKTVSVLLLSITLLPFSAAIGYLGFGFTAAREIGSADGYSGSMADMGLHAVISMDGFENLSGFGGYLSLAIFQLIDLEAEYRAARTTYNYNFSNYYQVRLISTTADDAIIEYSRSTLYLTAGGKVKDFSLPLIGHANLHAGIGTSFHRYTPYLTIKMLEELLGEDIYRKFDPGQMEDRVSEYLMGNARKKTGYHLQLGFRIKHSGMEASLFYRHTLARDVNRGSPGFGAVILSLGAVI